MNTQLIALYLLTQMRNQEKTYDELSDKTGIPKSSLQRYLTGEREIPIDRFKMICDALEWGSRGREFKSLHPDQ